MDHGRPSHRADHHRRVSEGGDGDPPRLPALPRVGAGPEVGGGAGHRQRRSSHRGALRAAGMGRSTQYTLAYDHAEPGVLSWVLSEGDITRKLDGRYVLEPAGVDATLVTYELEVDLIIPLPGFVKRRTQGKIMHAALDELKTVAERAAA
ncbi:MAG: SRPBCC family protein [Acidimicrobiales bacterium]